MLLFTLIKTFKIHTTTWHPSYQLIMPLGTASKACWPCRGNGVFLTPEAMGILEVSADLPLLETEKSNVIALFQRATNANIPIGNVYDLAQGSHGLHLAISDGRFLDLRPRLGRSVFQRLQMSAS